MDVKIKKFFGIEEILEENLKRVFTILHGQYIRSLLAKLEGDKKYECINSNQDVIEILKLIKGVIFKFDSNKKLTHTMWEVYVSVLQCRQKKFEKNQ